MMDTQHPHNEFFKKSFSNPTVAKDLLKAHLSPSIAKYIGWDTL